MLATHEDSSSFDKKTSYLISTSALYPAPCKASHRWDFECKNMYKSPQPFNGQSGGGASDQGTDPGPKGPLPRMSDGRQYTDYRPSFVTQLCDQKPMSSSYDYRQQQIHSATEIMVRERGQAYTNVTHDTCKTPWDIGTMLPEQDKFVCDKVACRREDTLFPCTGMGTGRTYVTDTK
jgi:hypothetical protein